MKALRLILAALLLTAIFSSLAVRADNLNSGLVAAYLLNGNGHDSSGHGNNLTLVGSPSFVPGLFGQSALQLNGTNTQYAVGPQAISFAGDFTIAIWADFYTHNSEATLIEDFTGAGGPGWTLTTPGNAVQIYDNGSLNGAYGAYGTNQWNMYLAERSGNTLSLYFDGTLVASQSLFGMPSGSSNPLLIGRRDPQDGRNFNVNGALSDAGIWDLALSGSQIQSLYQNGLAAETPEPNSLMLLGAGLAGFAGVFRRKRSRVKRLRPRVD